MSRNQKCIYDLYTQSVSDNWRLLQDSFLPSFSGPFVTAHLLQPQPPPPSSDCIPLSILLMKTFALGRAAKIKMRRRRRRPWRGRKVTTEGGGGGRGCTIPRHKRSDSHSRLFPLFEPHSQVARNLNVYYNTLSLGLLRSILHF